MTVRAARAVRPGRNLPVPAAPRAPLSFTWLWWIGPPAVITLAYRTIARRLWNRSGGSTSHVGLAAILAGGGWRAFAWYAMPRHGTETNWVPLKKPIPGTSMPAWTPG